MLMTPYTRKFVLTAHVVASVGLLGSIASFLVLSIAGIVTENIDVVRSVYPAMQLIAQFVIVPLAVFSVLTGVVQSLGTPWGLFQHYWVFIKLLITVFATVILLIKMPLVAFAAHLAPGAILHDASLHAAGVQLTVHAAAGLLVLLVPMVLSTYKPKGLTKYGIRQKRAARAA